MFLTYPRWISPESGPNGRPPFPGSPKSEASLVIGFGRVKRGAMG